MPVTEKRAAATSLVALSVALGLVLWVFAPFFRDPRAMGFQDWDVQAAYRYVTVLSLQKYGQWPAFNPWLCGGFPAWGYAEAATNLVSPFAPLYFAFPFPLALRLEAVGATLVAVLTSYLLAGRFTRSPGWRMLVAVMVALSSRWALQISSGHMWHLAYAWMPLALYCFDRALGERALSWAAGAGAAMALMVYVGGIYPFPHTALLLAALAIVAAAQARSRAPLIALGVAGLVALGLAAPKLAPVMVTLARFPRVIGSNEPITLADLWVMLTARNQSFGGHPLLHISFAWVWWEWGIYIGVIGVLALGVGLWAGRRRRPELLGLRLAGLLCFLLALGQSIWQGVHLLPYFQSQHVPSRMLVPGVLCLALAAVGGIDEPWRRFVASRRWAEPALLAVVTLYALDLAVVARQATGAPFRLEVPTVRQSPAFAQVAHQPYHYGKPEVGDRRLRERYEWPSKIVYPTMLANLGNLACYGIPPEVRSTVLGSDQPGYRGLAFLASGRGTAEVRAWTPNAVTIEVAGATPGDTLVYDMNFDRGWRADGGPALAWRGLVAAPIARGDEVVHLRYRPPGLMAGLGLFGATLAAVAGFALVARRRGAGAGRQRAR